MVADEDGTVLAVLTYSGEVYNFRELRAELTARGHRFRTRSDTEVVLRAYLEWGEALADRLNGMFAFAIWDARDEELLLVRDRMGIKPLYYYPTPDGVLFGSEPKAILANPLRRAGRSTPTGCGSCSPSSRRRGTRSAAACTRCARAQSSRSTAAGCASAATGRCEPDEHTDDLDTTVAHRA